LTVRDVAHDRKPRFPVKTNLSIAVAAASMLFSMAAWSEDCTEMQWGGTDTTHLQCGVATSAMTSHALSSDNHAQTSSGTHSTRTKVAHKIGPPHHALAHAKTKKT
jgi:hypothetical protein